MENYKKRVPQQSARLVETESQEGHMTPGHTAHARLRTRVHACRSNPKLVTRWRGSSLRTRWGGGVRFTLVLTVGGAEGVGGEGGLWLDIVCIEEGQTQLTPLTLLGGFFCPLRCQVGGAITELLRWGQGHMTETSQPQLEPFLNLLRSLCRISSGWLWWWSSTNQTNKQDYRTWRLFLIFKWQMSFIDTFEALHKEWMIKAIRWSNLNWRIEHQQSALPAWIRQPVLLVLMASVSRCIWTDKKIQFYLLRQMWSKHR